MDAKKCCGGPDFTDTWCGGSGMAEKQIGKVPASRWDEQIYWLPCEEQNFNCLIRDPASGK